VFYSIFSQIRTDNESVQGPCTMNVRNEPLHDMACVEPLHDMACVEKCETSSEWRWELCDFQHAWKKKISFGNKFDWVWVSQRILTGIINDFQTSFQNSENNPQIDLKIMTFNVEIIKASPCDKIKKPKFLKHYYERSFRILVSYVFPVNNYPTVARPYDKRIVQIFEFKF